MGSEHCTTPAAADVTWQVQAVHLGARARPQGSDSQADPGSGAPRGQTGRCVDGTGDSFESAQCGLPASAMSMRAGAPTLNSGQHVSKTIGDLTLTEDRGFIEFQ